jgi:hypothetical protein
VLNHVKIFSEFQIFGVLLVCLIVQVHDTARGGKYLIIYALSYNPSTNLHINKSTEV